MTTSNATPIQTPAPGAGQYNAYLSDLSNLGGRYVAYNSLYLSVVSLLLGLLTIKVDNGAQMSQVLRICVPLFGIGVCFAWNRNIAHFRLLFDAKFTVLRAMETSGQIFPAFALESEYYEAKAPHWLLRNDLIIPVYLGLPFVAILVATLPS